MTGHALCHPGTKAEEIEPFFAIEIHKAVDERVGSCLPGDSDNRILNKPSFEAPKQRLLETYIQLV
jgi:hypothetical protein